MILSALSPAKVNLFLRIEGKRPDGYHDLETLMLKLDWGDPIELEFQAARQTHVDVTVPGYPELETPSNLAARAALAYLSAAGLEGQCRINITKRIFMGGGLGGGSSNAGVVLLMLQEQFGALGAEQIQAIAAELGADVPFFADPHNLALCYGRGDTFIPYDFHDTPSILLVNPRVHVSTPAVYQALNCTRHVEAAQSSRRRAWVEQALVLEDALLKFIDLGNDLQDPALRLCPVIAEVLASLKASGAKRVQMSGSGATVFGLFDTASQATAASKKFHEMAEVVVTNSLTRWGVDKR